MKKTLCIILLAALLLTALVSCTKEGRDDPSPNGERSASAQSDASFEDEPEQPDDNSFIPSEEESWSDLIPIG